MINDCAPTACPIEERLYRVVDSRLERAELHLGSLIVEVRDEALRRNETLNQENRQLAQRVTDLEGDAVTDGAGIRVADAKADAAIRQSAVVAAEAAVLRASVEVWARETAERATNGVEDRAVGRAKRSVQGHLWIAAAAQLLIAIVALLALFKPATPAAHAAPAPAASSAAR